MSAVEKRVGFGPRLGALLIDGIVGGIIGYVLSLALGGVIKGIIKAQIAGELGMDVSDPMVDMAVELAAGMTAILIGSYLGGMIVYALEIFLGATPGKMALGLKMGDHNGNPASTGALAIKFAFKGGIYIFSVLAFFTGALFLGYIGYLLAAVWFIGCFFVFGADKLSLTDKIAKVAVYKKADIGNISDNV